MTLAVADALIKCNNDYKDLSNKVIKSMKEIGRYYPDCGYGNRFFEWIFSNDDKPYNSYGNGATMRVSPCGWFGNNLSQVKELARKVTEVTHNHPEGIKGAEAVACAVFLARKYCKDKDGIKKIKKYICDNYYNINFTLME